MALNFPTTGVIVGTIYGDYQWDGLSWRNVYATHVGPAGPTGASGATGPTGATGAPIVMMLDVPTGYSSAAYTVTVDGVVMYYGGGSSANGGSAVIYTSTTIIPVGVTYNTSASAAHWYELR